MKLNKLFLIGCALIGFSNMLEAQVQVNTGTSTGITGSNVLIDGSTSFSTESGASPNDGKGIVVPSVDLVNFEFNLSLADGITFPTYFDGMIVYNRATGTTLTTGSRSSIATSVTPGFYYFYNPTGANSGSVTTGEWKKLGGASGKFVNGTNTMDAIYVDGNVGIGTSSPNSAAILEVNSTTKGFLPPRMSETQINAISSPVPGMIVYNTTALCLQVYGVTWECIGNYPVSVQQSFTGAGYTGVEIKGGSATTHYNGWVSGAYTGTETTTNHATGEPFSSYTPCADKNISVSPCTTTELSSGITDLDGNNYPVVTINGQCWMAKNMKQRPFYSRANTGTTWLNFELTDVGSWGYVNTSDLTGAAGWGSTEPTTASGVGMLYQWSAAVNNSPYERAKGICPTGYHVPSDCEFSYLEHGLGMKISDQSIMGASSTRGASGYVGKKLKSTSVPGNLGNNASGFNGIIAGYRNGTGLFSNVNVWMGEFWTSTTSEVNGAYNRKLHVSTTSYLNTFWNQSQSTSRASSLRCLKN